MAQNHPGPADINHLPNLFQNLFEIRWISPDAAILASTTLAQALAQVAVFESEVVWVTTCHARSFME